MVILFFLEKINDCRLQNDRKPACNSTFTIPSFKTEIVNLQSLISITFRPMFN